VIALFLSMFFLMLDQFLVFLPSSMVGVFEYLSFGAHYRNAARGVIDSRDVIYFLSFIVLCLFLSFRSLETRRWR
jgi:ABC-2 type transport system permease protein